MSVKQEIYDRLQATFSPVELEIVDDSQKHKGHAGAEGGAGHYTVHIRAALFENKSRVAAHREIYEVLADLIPHKIHALCIHVN